MKILSFDVGMKNLAFILFECNDNNLNILNWDIINLVDALLYFAITARYTPDCKLSLK